MSALTLPSYVHQALDALTDAGYQAFAVGGCVRDLLRGVTPHDFDLTTDATPAQMKAVFAAYRTVETGIKHGTLTVIVDGYPLEITTFRVDVGYSDARHPDAVKFASGFQEDAARRDFTVNAMAYHPAVGVLDCYGGKQDLQNQIIRAVGEPKKRFEEDALRILRAMRFASVLDFAIEPETANAMHEGKELLCFVSAERIREEFEKMLCGVAVLRILTEFADVLGVFLPEIIPAFDFAQHSPYHIYDVYMHTLHALAAAPADKIIRTALFFHDIGKPHCLTRGQDGVGHFYGHAARSAEIAEQVMRRLKYDNRTRQTVVKLVEMHDLVLLTEGKQMTRLRNKHGVPFLLQLLQVKRADCKAQAPAVLDRLQEYDEIEQKLNQMEAAAPPLSLATLCLSGKDLLAYMPPSAQMGEVLQKALSAVEDGLVSNEKNALLTYLKQEGLLP